MKLLSLAVLSTVVFTQSAAEARVIYGKDHRKEISEATPFQQKFARAAATMISSKEMTRSASRPGVVQFSQRSLRDWLESQLGDGSDKMKALFSPEVRKAAQAGISFCEGEAFVDQPNPGMCSGFLIAPDLLVTAGHCVELPTFCSEYKWVFGFDYDPATKKAGQDIKEEEIYGCKKVVSSALSSSAGLDYAIVQLDREVANREPVEFRNDSMIEDFTGIFVIGSPSGLPLKVADGAKVRNNEHPFYFNANLDTFQGNSGSGVFNAKTGMVEGILVRGEDDFVPNQEKMCVEANKCTDDGCRGESVSRMTSIPEIGVQAALNRASESGDMVTIERILKLNIWVDFYGKDKVTALMKASKNAKERAIGALIMKGADVNIQDVNGNTALHYLVKVLNAKTESALQALVNGKIKSDIKNKSGETAIDVAKLVNKDAVKILNKYGIK